MSVIEKLSISGIRSFDPDGREVIKFFQPLTLILGPNGCGKTTLIECLRYMATGDMPPNSDRGGSFVHDPKFANEQEVRARVQLQFKDVLGKKVVVSRALMVTQTLKKLTLKTLEGSIKRFGPNGEVIELSTKCAEIDSEMIGFLGVSKAILNHVIFCHQEESNWPLSEGKALKQRFDEIFAATRYIKALEEIRKKRNEMTSEIKVYQTQVESLVNNKRKAEEFQREMESNESRLSACKDSILDLERKLKPISDKLLDIKAKQDKIGNLQGQLDKSLELIKKYEKDEEDLRRSIGEGLFSGSKEDLEDEMQNFTAFMSQKRKKLEKLQLEMSNLQKNFQTDQKVFSRLLEELGNLKSKHELHKQDVALRDNKLRILRKELGLGDLGFDEEDPLEDTQVNSIMRNLKQRNSATVSEFQNCKLKHETTEKRLQDLIQSTCMEKAQKQMKLSSNNEQMAKNKTTLRNISDELNRLDSLANLQDNVEKDLLESEEELRNLECSMDVDDLRRQLSQKRQKRDESEQQMTALNQEMNMLQKESRVRHEIDLINKDIGIKQTAIDKVTIRHKDSMIHLLGEMPKESIYEKVTALVSNLNQKIEEMNKNLEKERSNLSSLKTTEKFHGNQLILKKEKLTTYQNKIFDVCGSQNFENNCETLKNNIKELQDEKGALTGSLYLFNKYIEKLKKPRPCCPLCTRSFQQVDEAQALISDLQKKLHSVPTSLEQKIKLIVEKEKMLSKMLELKPVKEAISDLLEKEIPELENKLEKVAEDISKSTSKITEMEEILDNICSDMKTASNLLPDLVLLDQNHSEMKRLDRRLTSLKLQIGGKDISRNVQQVSEEQNVLQSQIKNLNQEIEKSQQKITIFIDEVQQLKGRINDLKSEKNKMCSDIQKKSSLLDQSENIGKENLALAEASKEVKKEIGKLEVKLKELNKEKETVLQTKDNELQKLSSKMREEEREIESIEKISQDIDKYIQANKENQLIEHEEKIEKLRSQIDSKKAELERLVKTEKELHKDINSQELKYRNLEDNKRLIVTIEWIGNMNAECQKLKDRIGGYNIRSLHSDLEQLNTEGMRIKKEKDEAILRETEFKVKIKECRKQLQDEMFKDAEKKHKNKCIELRTTQLACEDLNKYYVALNKAIMNYHQLKMKEINKIIKDLWIRTYAGNDIDYIEIQSDEDGDRGIEKTRRTFNYRVVMFKGDTPTDMRGRCSAGQKVLASLIIRLALAETFCLNCGILALDEPTTNLDRENISKLAHALIDIVQSRSEQRNFQLIIITHDEDFIELLGRSETVEHFYKVSKDNNAHSKITKLCISKLN
ncbi:DNA repair protein RAD50 [Trichonephila inaurata madagascariensis]|uniref:DNA repair protein RAD50 n=1 Tax=Trichonephila inaurata madagascariensis TaxID=2747483 RepID=A0A8X6WQX3_9ARAC|nr:DNA repair protein RAD50 [Trichonephila inaurata madagascariensis]